MRVRRYVPGLWRGEQDGLHDLREEDWADLLKKSRWEIEQEERRERAIKDKDQAA